MNLDSLALEKPCVESFCCPTSQTSGSESIEEIFHGALQDILIQNLGVNVETAIFLQATGVTMWCTKG